MTTKRKEIEKFMLETPVQEMLISGLNNKHKILRNENETAEETLARWIYEEILTSLGF